MKKISNNNNKNREFSENLLEFKRQTFHLLLGLTISFGVYYTKPIYGDLILIPLIIALILMLLIPKISQEIEIVNHLLYHFERDINLKNFPFKGAFWYGLGIIFPILFLPLNIACAVVIVISVGDALSTFIGKFHGTHKVGDKTIEGFLAFVIFSSLAAAIFVKPELAFVFALLGGLIEFFTFMDDNFLVPVGLTSIYLIFNNVPIFTNFIFYF